MHSRLPSAAAALVLLASLLVAACGGSSGSAPPASNPAPASGAPSVFPVIISRELTVGANRVLFSFVDATGAPIGAPDRTVAVHFTGPGNESVEADDGTFIWAIENVSGVYVTDAKFPVAGAWTAEFTTEAPNSPLQKIPFSFDVLTDSSVVRPGEPAPSVDTPTLDDVDGDVSKISTDSSPDPKLYETSIADALTAHKPFVLAFATPKFCQTAVCGPTLEKVKEVAKKHPDITFINVEPYKLELVDGQLQPVLGANQTLEPVEATDAYGLLSEPFIFVVGGDGIVKASFEVVFTSDEIEDALKGLS